MPDAPLKEARSPNGRVGDVKQHGIVLNHDSASESEADAAEKTQAARNNRV